MFIDIFFPLFLQPNMRRQMYPSPRSPSFVKPRVTINDYNLSAGRSIFPFRTVVRSLIVLTCTSLFLTTRLYRRYSVDQKPVAFNKVLLSRAQMVESTRNQTIALRKSFHSGTAIVSACHNGHQSLSTAVSSWMRLPSVTEVILVDWASNPPLHLVIEEMDRFPRSNKQLIVLRVTNQSSFVPSQAFNIGFRYVTASQILKVDCFHAIHPYFFRRHTLKQNSFFTGSHEAARSKDEHSFASVLYIHSNVLHATGGYDERFDSFGGEHIELLKRLFRKGKSRLNLNYDTLNHIHFTNSLGKRNNLDTQRFDEDVTQIEIETNLRLLPNFPEWNITFATISSQFASGHHLTTPSFRHQHVHYVSLNVSRMYTSTRVSTSPSHFTACRMAAIANFISRRYAVPSCLTQTLPLSERFTLLHAFSDAASHENAKPRAVIALATGLLSSRLMLFASARSLAREAGRELIVIWPRVPGVVDRYTSFTKLFASKDDITFIESLDDSCLTKTSCPMNQIVDNTGIYSFYEGTQHGHPVIQSDKLHHIVVQGDTYIRTDVLRYSNPKSVRAILQSMSISPQLEAHLQTLNTEGLSQSIGVYVPPISNDANRTDAFKLFSAVHEKVTSLTTKADDIVPIFLHADEQIIQRLKASGMKRILVSKESFGCSNLEHSKCFISELLNVMALTRTKYFFSPVSNHLTRFVHLYRGDDVYI